MSNVKIQGSPTGTGNITLVAPVTNSDIAITLPSAGGTLVAGNEAGVALVAQGGTGLTSLTANNVIIGNGTSSPQFVAPGTAGNVLTSNGTSWTSAPGGGGGGGISSARVYGLVTIFGV